ncbi:TULIP family P47-like protein [Bordetella sp. LUAb4]|uniref:TULIP family P47-like protein n=1 Tax=Bordetella sp. LUAb4 TaxID=2843195 RepID=UPI001E2F8A20|nr:TULIP family P47-like protein [Bordetella sp. LUAb4]
MVAESVSTLGWDLVHAVRIPTVNAQIAEQAGPPRELAEVVQGVEVTACVRGWRIVPGGSEYLVFLAVDLHGGRLSAPGNETQDFEGVAVVAAELRAVQWNGADGQRTAVELSPTGESRAGRIRPFSVREVRLDGMDDVLIKGMVQQAVQQWVNRNPDDIRHVFATVESVEHKGGQPFPWLHPTTVGFAYCDAPAIEDCMLAVLAMVNDRPPTGLDHGISARAVPQDCDAAILVSSHLLLDGIIRDVLARTFPGAREEDYALSPVLPVLSLTRELEISPIDLKGIPRKHFLKAFSVTFQGAELLCRSENMVIIDEGVTVTTFTEVAHSLELEPQADGSLQLRFTTVGEPRVDHRTDVDAALVERDEHIADGIMIAGTILSLFGGPLVFIVVTAETALMSGMAANGRKLLAAISPPAPSIDLLAAHAAAPCVWSGGHTFEVSTIDLAGCLRFGGKLR